MDTKHTAARRNTMWFRFALFASVLTPVLHVAVLIVSGQDASGTPISELSRRDAGALHTLALILFGAAHVALAVGLNRIDRGRLWPVARLLLVASGITLVWIAWYFATASAETLRGPDANDPLWVVASLTGVAMGALQPGLSRRSRGLGLYSAVCLGVWLLLVPLILLVDESWIGAYERIVGTVYVAWMIGVTFGLIDREPRRAPG